MKPGVGLVELQQLALERRELEEVVFFADRLGDASAIGAGRSGGTSTHASSETQYWPVYEPL